MKTSAATNTESRKIMDFSGIIPVNLNGYILILRILSDQSRKEI